VRLCIGMGQGTTVCAVIDSPTQLQSQTRGPFRDPGCKRYLVAAGVRGLRLTGKIHSSTHIRPTPTAHTLPDEIPID